MMEKLVPEQTQQGNTHVRHPPEPQVRLNPTDQKCRRQPGVCATGCTSREEAQAKSSHRRRDTGQRGGKSLHMTD